MYTQWGWGGQSVCMCAGWRCQVLLSCHFSVAGWWLALFAFEHLKLDFVLNWILFGFNMFASAYCCIYPRGDYPDARSL